MVFSDTEAKGLYMHESYYKNWFSRHKFLTVLAVLAIAGTAYILRPGKSNPNPYLLSSTDTKQETQAPAKSAKQPEQVQLGQTKSDGNFEITVKGIKCGEETIGTNEYAHSDAAGTFCRLQLTIKNIASGEQSLPAESIKLIDDKEEKRTFDSSATLYAQQDLNAAPWYEGIKSGVTVSGDIVFDLPDGRTTAKAIIVGDKEASGIEVQLN